MATKIKYWVKLKTHNKEAIIDVTKIGHTDDSWAELSLDEQDSAVHSIPNVIIDWGYGIVRG